MSQRSLHSVHLHAVNTDQMRTTQNTLPADTRHVSIEAMNSIVAHMIDVALAAKHAHWNVRGPGFLSYHQLFDRTFNELMTQIDAVGERVTALGGIAQGTVQTVVGATPLAPYPVLSIAEQEHATELSMRLGQLGTTVRAAAIDAGRRDDIVTADVLTDASAAVDSLLWLIESHRTTEPAAVASE